MVNGNSKHNHVPNGNGNHNGNHAKSNDKQQQQQQQRITPARQRIPNPDDFPVLAGSTTPPSRSPGPHGRFGPTAAQVLQAPPPTTKKDLLRDHGSANGEANDHSNMPSSPNDVSDVCRVPLSYSI